MAKCEKCLHDKVCKNKENMLAFEKEIREKEKLLENKLFHVDIRCECYQDGKTSMYYPPGVR